MTKITELEPKDILISEKNKTLTDMVKLDINIAVLERTDPDTVVAKKTTKTDEQGNVTAYSPITAKQMLESSRQDRAGKTIRINVIETLMKKDDKTD